MFKPELEAPAIYHFADSSWGWCKVEDLLEAVNNTRRLHELSLLTRAELFDRFLPFSMSDGPGWLSVRETPFYKQRLIGLKSRTDLLVGPLAPAGWAQDVLGLVRVGVVRTLIREEAPAGPLSFVKIPCRVVVGRNGEEHSWSRFAKFISRK